MDADVRDQIATEAARLLLRGKERDFAAARKRAARWLKRRKVRREDMPSNAEIQVQMYALSGVMSSERDPAVLWQMRQFSVQLMELLADWQPSARGAVVDECVTPGAEIVVIVNGSRDVVAGRLRAAGMATRNQPLSALDVDAGILWRLRVLDCFPAVIEGVETPQFEGNGAADSGSTASLQALLDSTPCAAPEAPTDEHPDAYSIFQMLLEPLAKAMLDPIDHPEGDALYHTLQVFELGVNARPYDAEFLLACLLHDVGQAINPRHPVLSAIDALGTLVTDRTRLLIELRPVAAEFLRTGVAPRSLRNSEDFEDAVLLARLDRAGRVPGTNVRTLDEAFDFLRALDAEWDDVDD